MPPVCPLPPVPRPVCPPVPACPPPPIVPPVCPLPPVPRPACPPAPVVPPVCPLPPVPRPACPPVPACPPPPVVPPVCPLPPVPRPVCPPVPACPPPPGFAPACPAAPADPPDALVPPFPVVPPVTAVPPEALPPVLMVLPEPPLPPEAPPAAAPPEPPTGLVLPPLPERLLGEFPQPPMAMLRAPAINILCDGCMVLINALRGIGRSLCPMPPGSGSGIKNWSKKGRCLGAPVGAPPAVVRQVVIHGSGFPSVRVRVRERGKSQVPVCDTTHHQGRDSSLAGYPRFLSHSVWRGSRDGKRNVGPLHLGLMMIGSKSNADAPAIVSSGQLPYTRALGRTSWTSMTHNITRPSATRSSVHIERPK